MNRFNTPVEDLYCQHPKFLEYSEFLSQSIEPECQDCAYTFNFTADLALRVLEKAATFNKRCTKIIGIDDDKEERALLSAQREIQEICRPCEGPIVVDVDVEQQTRDIEYISRLAHSNPEKTANRIAAILPVAAECDLIFKHRQSPPQLSSEA